MRAANNRTIDFLEVMFINPRTIRTMSPRFRSATNHSAVLLPAMILLVQACAPSAPQVGPTPGVTAAAITANDVRHRVLLIADDSMRGRDTGTPGITAAARYLASEAERLGLRPAGDNGTYYNRSELQRRQLNVQVTVSLAGGTLTPGLEELVSVSGMIGLPTARDTEGRARLVFAGHLVDPAIGARELSPADLTGAAVIIRLSPPAGVDPQTTPPRMPLAALIGPGSTAAAVLLVAEEGEQELWTYVSGIARRGAIQLPGAPVVPRGPAVFMVSAEFAERLLQAPLAGARQPRMDLGTFEYTLRESVEPLDAWNIVAALPGRDTARAGQYVSVGAHYDHVGVGAAIDGDSIYNGADDNASGTSGLLEVAEYLASEPANRRPARSVLFIWYTAEEHGLLGSRTFTDDPTIPRDSIIVNINADMIGRNSPDSIFVVGSGRLSSELAQEVEAANSRLTRPFVLDYSYDAPDHPERIFCRSDHYSFARFAIPIVFFTTGLHEDYHLPSDTPARLDYEKASRVAMLLGDLTRTLADRPNRLRIDQPVEAAGAECEM
ncbi:hypothetical protein BH23GEM6_BH23GEM6_21170 [soil metagenome]